MTLQDQFQTFVDYWRQHIRGYERGDANSFVEYFFKALGYEGALQAGGHFEERVRRQQDGKTSTKFADYVIPKKVLIEMKSRGEDLRRHYDQALNYWIDLAEDRPQYVILCNFDELWIYDLNVQPREPMDKVRVEELPQRHPALSFLLPIPKKPEFANDRVAVTKEAAFSLSRVLRSLMKRGIEQQQAQRFVLQSLLALFAENIGLLPSRTFSNIITDSLQAGKLEAVEIKFSELVLLLFTIMNKQRKHPAGRFYDVPYFDGGLFAEIDPVELTTTELELLQAATQHDWSLIHPGIFGAVFEESLEAAERHQTGSHFTYEVDILRIVRPVIVRPWHERILAAATVADLRALHEELCAYKVFDPACGSGNFLYVAYRELKRLERELFDRIRDLGGEYTPTQRVNTAQFYGYDIQPFAVELAKVTLMIAKKLSIDEVNSPESPLPLDNLNDNIKVADALLTDWPDFDACIGNPPYLGAKRLKVEYGAAYVNQIRAAFPEVPGNADYCVYWFRKAQELMKPGARAGLVGTNTIRQNYSRIGGLDYVVATGGKIYEAFSSFPWSGEAVVHVSIVCWSKGEQPYKPARLWLENGGEEKLYVVDVPLISSSLSPKMDVSSAQTLSINAEPKRVFQGQTPGHNGFVLSSNEAREMIAADLFSREVIFPYLTGDDLVGERGGKPSRYIIDFGGRSLDEARNFKAPYKRLEALVLPDFQTKAQAEIARNLIVLQANPKAKANRHHQGAVNKWWLHFYERTERKEAMADAKRYIVCSRVTKRPIFEFVSALICPSDALQTFIFEDDYSLGILHSHLHRQWFIEKASTLKSDFRYTPHSVFDTLPWPQNPKPKQVKAIADAARNLHEYRREVMSSSRELTLRELYRLMELPGKTKMKELHAALDKAVMAAYGFDEKGDVLAQLLALNTVVAERIKQGDPVTAPGIPAGYPNPAGLVSDGCITPPELI